MFSSVYRYTYSKDRTWDIDQCYEPLQEMKVIETNSNRFLFLVVTMSVVELCIYINLSLFIYQQDKVVKHMLPPSRYKTRNRRNAIDFSGHFAYFIIELLTSVFFMLGETGSKSKTKSEVQESIGLVISHFLAVLAPVLTIALSDTLKQELSSLVAQSPLSRRIFKTLSRIKSGNDHVEKQIGEMKKEVILAKRSLHNSPNAVVAEKGLESQQLQKVDKIGTETVGCAVPNVITKDQRIALTGRKHYTKSSIVSVIVHSQSNVQSLPGYCVSPKQT